MNRRSSEGSEGSASGLPFAPSLMAVPGSVHPFFRFGREVLRENAERPLLRILQILERAKGAEFSQYRRTSILRAIGSRMHMTEARSPADYARLLRRNSGEVEKLYERILIKTTGFFRDPGAFDSLKWKVLLPMVRGRTMAPIRVWVAGCSTGEEAYSVAICLEECFTLAENPLSYQILATDLSEAALRKARTAEYTLRLLDGVSPKRLARFFTRTPGGYRISRTIRGNCIFSLHNLVQSPPFAKMDLISCRNVLIYMEPALQRRALSALHYALKPRGFLMLGMTESTSGSPGWEAVDPKHRLYRRA